MSRSECFLILSIWKSIGDLSILSLNRLTNPNFTVSPIFVEFFSMVNQSEFHGNSVNSSSDESPDNLEEAMRELKLEEKDEEGLDKNHEHQYPERPGATDCIYYLRTGLCGYGNNCKYNHPNHNGQGVQDKDLPERVGQPECQYFLKTGTCKFGATCKYHHPRERYDVPPAPLNMLGLPIRQDEKPCPYYIRTGSCKFGTACKFNHPELVYGPSAAYAPTGPTIAPLSNFPVFGGFPSVPLARPYLSNPIMQGVPGYVPFVHPSSQCALPMQQSWNTYMGSVPQFSTNDNVGSTQIVNKSASSGIIDLPERPDQPECQFYMKNGSCKYGTSCKYNHPKERQSESPVTLGPLGLPLRSGHPVCNFYTMYGTCKYGPACKYDHPFMGYYNYAMPTVSTPEPSPQPQHQKSYHS